MTEVLDIECRPKPIDPTTFWTKVPVGYSVAQIVEHCQSRTSFPLWTCMVNEERVKPHMWPYVRPKAGARVFVGPVYGIGGGGPTNIVPAGAGGGKDLSSIIGLFAGTLPGIGPFGQLAIGVGMNVLGNLFAKKPKQQVAQNDSPGQMPQVGFSANSLGVYDPIPFVIGRMRVAPSLLTDLWLVSTSPQDLEARGVVGLLGHYDISDIRANGVPIGDADGVEYETFDGNGTAALALHDHVGVTDEVGFELKKHETTSDTSVELSSELKNGEAIPQWYSFLTKKAPDEIIINLQFPAGMSHRSSATAVIYLHLRIRMRRKGTTTWRNLPEIQIRSTKSSASTFQRRIRIKWFGSPELGEETAAVQASAAAGAWYYQSDQGNGSLGPASWTADAYFTEGVTIGTDVNNQAGHALGNATLQPTPNVDDEEEPEDPLLGDGFDFIAWLRVNDWPQDYYEVQIKRSAITTSQGNAVGTNSSVGRWNEDGAGTRVDPFLYYEPDPGDFRIAPAQGPMTDTVVIGSITYKWVEPPLQRPNTAAIAFKLRNSQIDHLTAIFHSYMPTPTQTGTSGFVNSIPSRNPAAAWRFVLTDETINDDPIDESLLPDLFLEEWYDYCETNGLTFDVFWDGGTVEDILPLIARAGDAFPSISPREWKVWIDRDRSADAPEIVFSPRNVRDFMVERSFEDVAHAIKATFADEDDDNRQKEIFVYDDPYDENTATNIEARDYRGITSETLVRRAALRELRRARLRRNTYSWETNLIMLNLEPGRLVGISHDVLQGAYGWGCISEIVTDTSGDISAIYLDAAVNLPGEITDVYDIVDIYQVDDILASPALVTIGLSDGSGIVNAYTSSIGRTSVLEFATPIAANALIEAQCFVAVGQYASTHKRVIIQKVTPGPNLTARVIATDEANEIFEE